jgi:hypothetical protein
MYDDCTTEYWSNGTLCVENMYKHISQYISSTAEKGTNGETSGFFYPAVTPLVAFIAVYSRMGLIGSIRCTKR